MSEKCIEQININNCTITTTATTLTISWPLIMPTKMKDRFLRRRNCGKSLSRGKIRRSDDDTLLSLFPCPVFWCLLLLLQSFVKTGHRRRMNIICPGHYFNSIWNECSSNGVTYGSVSFWSSFFAKVGISCTHYSRVADKKYLLHEV